MMAGEVEHDRFSERKPEGLRKDCLRRAEIFDRRVVRRVSHEEDAEFEVGIFLCAVELNRFLVSVERVAVTFEVVQNRSAQELVIDSGIGWGLERFNQGKGLLVSSEPRLGFGEFQRSGELQ